MKAIFISIPSLKNEKGGTRYREYCYIDFVASKLILFSFLFFGHEIMMVWSQ